MNSNNEDDLPSMEELIHEEQEEEEIIEETPNNMTRLFFLEALTNIINGNGDDNIRILPLSRNNNRLRQILQQSLYEKQNYKKVLSDEGNQQLKVIKFDPKKFETDECVITHEKFKKDEDIIQLPCGHIFNKEAIETWLKEESAKCPICRFELKCKEIKEQSENPEETSENSEQQTENSEEQSENSEEQTENPEETSENREQRRRRILSLIHQMDLMYNPFNFINNVNTNSLNNQRTFVNNIISRESQFVEDRDLQNAIMASIHEQNLTENDEYIEEEKNLQEDDIENHPDFDFDTQHMFGDIESDSDMDL